MIEAVDILRVLQRSDRIAKAVINKKGTSKDLVLYALVALDKSRSIQEQYRQALQREDANNESN